MALAVRAVSSVYVNNVNSGTVALPAGAAAGDSVLIFAGHAFAPNTPAGWTKLEGISQSNYSGAVFSKTIDATDVTAGQVTVTFGGAFYGHIVAVCFVGAYAGIRSIIQTGSTGGAATRTIATDGMPLTGDYALYFGGGRVNAAITSGSGAALGSANALNSSWVLTGQNLAANGITSDTFGYPTVPTGDYQTIIVLTDVAIPTIVDVADIAAEVLLSGSPSVQVADIAAEVLLNAGNNAFVQVADIGIEVLMTITTVARRRPVYIGEVTIIEGPAPAYPANAVVIDGDTLLIDGSSVEF